ncbi:unnamed protein product [Malus baccata var. baccata]
MAQFQNDELEYVDDYYDVVDFDDTDAFADNQLPGGHDADSDFDDDDFDEVVCSVYFGNSKAKTDTSAMEARNGKDIQGIPYRETRLKQYKNYENLSRPRQDLEKECLPVETGKTFYDFHYNTRIVKSTIVHFQVEILFLLVNSLEILLQQGTSQLDLFLPRQLRNLLWATSKHDVYVMQNFSVMHWSSLLRRGKEVLNVAKPVVPTEKRPGLLVRPLSRVQISTMAVKENLLVAGGFQGELICKHINQPGVAFCSKLTTDDNAITNAVDVFQNPAPITELSLCSGSMRVMTANNDAQVRVFDVQNFTCLNCFSFDWSVNNTSVSPDGKLVAVLGDSTDCLIADAQSGKVSCIVAVRRIHFCDLCNLKGHLDYCFSSAWHPNGQILATGNQDTTCRLWDIRNLSESVAVLKGRMGAIRAIKFTSDGRFMAMAEPADFVHILDTQCGYVKEQEIDLFGEIAGISFSPDTEALFVGIADRTYGSVLELDKRHRNQYLEAVF